MPDMLPPLNVRKTESVTKLGKIGFPVNTESRNYETDNIFFTAQILDTDESKIQKYVTKSNDIALSIGHAHDKKVKNEKCGWSLQKLERYLEKLSGLDEDDARLNHLKFAAKRMRYDELEVLIRLIRKDLDTDADAKTILKGVNEKAFSVFEQDGLDGVVEK
uniref:DNA_ligase_A_N domain-containing protein n=1 Tax=Caenorhabditis japonica TaxID=281687 RepID=A0A8R1E8J5_CAEJA